MRFSRSTATVGKGVSKMTRKSTQVILASIILSVVPGCGTLLNLKPEPPALRSHGRPIFKLAEKTQVPFGGVRMDASNGCFCLLCACHLEEQPLTFLFLGTYILAVD